MMKHYVRDKHKNQFSASKSKTTCTSSVTTEQIYSDASITRPQNIYRTVDFFKITTLNKCLLIN